MVSRFEFISPINNLSEAHHAFESVVAVHAYQRSDNCYLTIVYDKGQKSYTHNCGNDWERTQILARDIALDNKAMRNLSVYPYISAVPGYLDKGNLAGAVSNLYFKKSEIELNSVFKNAAAARRHILQVKQKLDEEWEIRGKFPIETVMRSGNVIRPLSWN